MGLNRNLCRIVRLLLYLLFVCVLTRVYRRFLKLHYNRRWGTGVFYTPEQDALNLVNYVASRIYKTNFSPVLYVFEVNESIFDIFTELPCSRDLENLGQLPVLLPILLRWLHVFLSFRQSLYFRGRGIHFFAVSRSYHV